MEDFSFDIDGILPEEEAKKLFEDAENPEEVEQTPTGNTETEENNPVEDNGGKTPRSEEVDVETTEIKNDAVNQDGGSSPNIYASIANALKIDGILPDCTDDEVKAVNSPDAFAELLENAISSRLDERQRRIEQLLNNGVEPDAIKSHESTISYLESIDDETISAEDENGENVRKQLIYNDFIKKGFTRERALKEVNKSFRDKSDVEDAKEALESLKTYFSNSYKKIQDDAKKREESAREAQKKQADDFKKLLIDNDVKFGDVAIDKKTRQRAYDAVTKPVYKDPDTGNLLTAVQKMQKDNPLEFLKQLGLWYALTDGGKGLNGIVKEKLRVEKNKGIRELERSINASSLNPDGTLKYASPLGENTDPLMSDAWKVGW